jgi:hypothetical protein
MCALCSAKHCNHKAWWQHYDTKSVLEGQGDSKSYKYLLLSKFERCAVCSEKLVWLMDISVWSETLVWFP